MPRASRDLSVLARARSALLAARAVVPHTDADGLAAGALALRARGEDASAAILLGRGSSPWNSALPGGPLAVLDWGVRPGSPPGVLVDHHAPETHEVPGAVVVSGHGEEPETSTSALVARLLDGAPWLAAVGAYGDLGSRGLALPECSGAPRTAVRRLVPLVNAPRRLPDGPVREALAVLVDAESPAAALADPRTRLLDEAKDEWQAGLKAVLRTPPQVRGDVALLRFSSPYQVHPIVATTWSRRLAPAMVLAANEDYVPGRVSFAVRGGAGDLRRRLQAALPDAAGGEFAHGHPGATGGTLLPDDFERLLTGLGAA